MAANDVVIRMSAQNAQALQALVATQQGFKQVENAIGSAVRKSEEIGTKTKKGLDDSTSSAQKFASSVYSIGAQMVAMTGAVQLLRAEWDRVEQLRARAEARGAGQGGLFARAALALGGDARDARGQRYTPERLFEVFRSQAPKSGLTPETAAAAAETVLAGRGSLTPDVAMAQMLAVQNMAGVFGNDPEGLARMSAGALQLRKADPKISEQQAAAAAFQLFSQSTISNPAQFAKNILPIAAQIRTSSTSTEQASLAEVMSTAIAVGETAGDFEGERTRGNMSTILNNVRNFLLKERPDFRGTTTEQRQLILESPELQAKLLGAAAIPFLERSGASSSVIEMARKAGVGKLGGEGNMKGAFTELFLPGSDTSRRYEEVLGSLGGEIGDVTVQRALAAKREREADPSVQAFMRRQGREAGVSILEGSTPLVKKGSAQQEVLDILAASDMNVMSYAGSRLAMFGAGQFGDHRSMAGVGKSILEAKQAQIARGGGTGAFFTAGALTPYEMMGLENPFLESNRTAVGKALRGDSGPEVQSQVQELQNSIERLNAILMDAPTRTQNVRVVDAPAKTVAAPDAAALNGG